MNLSQIAREIADAASKSQGANIKFAAQYARLLPQLSGEALRVQILYTLSNLGGWRGETAKLVKAALNAELKK